MWKAVKKFPTSSQDWLALLCKMWFVYTFTTWEVVGIKHGIAVH